MAEELRLGIIGLSQGNGHPYSWSAILNGYEPEAMANCGFPVIPQYLAKQKWPEARLEGARVTHVWTQDPNISKQIAEAAFIPHVCERMEGMIGSVDGVLLARDDPKNHRVMAEPFLKAGLPIFIDKPLATSVAEAEAVFDLEQFEGQVFSCSALRYAPDFPDATRLRHEIGEPKSFACTTPKSWHKYAVHIVEPTLGALGFPALEHAEEPLTNGDATLLPVRLSNGVLGTFLAGGFGMKVPLELRFMGSEGTACYPFVDSFTAFRNALEVFLESVRRKSRPIPKAQTLAVTELIEKGMSG